MGSSLEFNLNPALRLFRPALPLAVAMLIAVGIGALTLAGAAAAPLPSLADIVERVSPAVVSLTVKVEPAAGRRGGTAVGSGFVIDPTGFVVTNNHVVANASEIEVRFADGTKLKARLIGRDAATDVALIKVDGGRPLAAVKFGDDRNVRVGDWVLAVGNPFGLGGTVTAGIVSARGRDEVGSAQFTDYLQVDAAINQGNSGGPTFDMSGRVIGMNTLGYVSTTGDRATGIGFAIPASTVQRVVADLKAGGVVNRGFLGVTIQSLSDDVAQAVGLPNTNGAIVTDVIAGSPAEKAGIKQGDVVLKMNGQAIRNNSDLSRRIAALQAGQTATFTIWRDNKEITITVSVAKREQVALNEVPEAETPKAEIRLTSLGLAMQTITSEVRSAHEFNPDVSGVLITAIDPGGDAARRGISVGDRIVAVGGTEVKSLGDVNLAVEAARALNRPMVVLFVVNSAGVKSHVAVKLGKN